MRPAAADAGDLDLLGSIGKAKLTYEEVLARSSQVTLDDGLMARVLDLDTLIDFKQEAGRPKDLLALPVLRATLEERSRPA